MCGIICIEVDYSSFRGRRSKKNKDSTLKVEMSTFLHSPKAQHRLNDLWNN